jgi:hypothetical protein
LPDDASPGERHGWGLPESRTDGSTDKAVRAVGSNRAEGEDLALLREAGEMLILQNLHVDTMPWALKEVKRRHRDDKPGAPPTW